MKEELLLYFKEHITNKKLIFDYIKVQYICFMSIFFLLVIAFLPLIVLFGNTNFMIVILVSFCLLILLTVHIFNYNIKIFLTNKYQIHILHYFWNNTEYQKLRKRLLVKYLKSRDLLCINKLATLIDALNRDMELSHVNFPIAPSIFALLFIPLWNNLIGWIYKQNEIQTFQYAIKIFLYSLIAIIMISFCIFVVQDSIKSFWEDWINSKVYRIKDIINLLDDIKIDLILKND